MYRSSGVKDDNASSEEASAEPLLLSLSLAAALRALVFETLLCFGTRAIVFFLLLDASVDTPAWGVS